jgi:hypothetical protein
MKRQRQLTPEDIASHYSAAMDSVNLINGDKSELMTDAEWAECISQNKLHLKIMIEKDFWTSEDLSPLKDAIRE